MPDIVTYSETSKIIIVESSGDLEMKDFIESLEKVKLLAGLHDCNKVLIDASRQKSAPEYSEFYEFAKLLPIDMSTAIYASGKTENQLRFLESIVLNYRGKMKVCLSLDKALEWLGVPRNSHVSDGATLIATN